MKILKCLNASIEGIESKEFNIFIGISLGNKYFTPKHIREYLLWAMQNTKDKVAVLIPDKIHAVNYEVKNEYSRERALSVATRKGDDVEAIIEEAKQELKIPDSKLSIFRWHEIESENYMRMLEVFRSSFKTNQAFRSAIMTIVTEAPQLNGDDLTEAQKEQLAQYVIDEMPMLMSGIEANGTYYEVLPYPGLANIDYLALDLQEGKSFPAITKQLDIKIKLKIVEAYVG